MRDVEREREGERERVSEMYRKRERGRGSNITCDSVSRFAGSAGTIHSTERVSTAMTPQGIPPSLARPHTTV